MENKLSVLKKILTEEGVLYDKAIASDMGQRRYLYGDAIFSENFAVAITSEGTYKGKMYWDFYELWIVNVENYNNLPRESLKILTYFVDKSDHISVDKIKESKIRKIKIISLTEDENSVTIKYKIGKEIKAEQYKKVTKKFFILE